AAGVAGALIQLFGGPGGVLGGIDVDQTVVLAHEERVERGEGDVVVDTVVAGDGFGGRGGAEGVAGEGALGGAGGAGAGDHPCAGVGGAAAEDRSVGRIGSVDGGAVDEGGGEVGLLARVADAGAGGGVEAGAGQFDGLAGNVDVVAGGDGEVDELG